MEILENNDVIENDFKDIISYNKDNNKEIINNLKIEYKTLTNN